MLPYPFWLLLLLYLPLMREYEAHPLAIAPQLNQTSVPTANISTLPRNETLPIFDEDHQVDQRPAAKIGRFFKGVWQSIKASAVAIGTLGKSLVHDPKGTLQTWVDYLKHPRQTLNNLHAYASKGCAQDKSVCAGQIAGTVTTSLVTAGAGTGLTALGVGAKAVAGLNTVVTASSVASTSQLMSQSNTYGHEKKDSESLRQHQDRLKLAIQTRIYQLRLRKEGITPVKNETKI